MQKITCADPSNFSQALSEAEEISANTSKPLFLLFFAERLASTGKSWCPDCVAAEPIILGALSTIPNGCIYLESIVKREDYKVYFIKTLYDYLSLVFN